MIKMVAGMICLAASLYPVVADAGGAGAGNDTRQAAPVGVPKLVDDGHRARLEAAVNDVLRHFDAGDYAGLAAEMSASKSMKDDADIKAEGFVAVAESLDMDSERRFASINLHAYVADPKADPNGYYASMSHLRTCGGIPCEEQVVMRWVDGRWVLAGFYVIPRGHSTAGNKKE